MDSTAFRQPLLAFGLARGSFAAGGDRPRGLPILRPSLAFALGGGWAFRPGLGLGRGLGFGLRRRALAWPAWLSGLRPAALAGGLGFAPIGAVWRCGALAGLVSLARPAAGALGQRPVDRRRHLVDRRHAVDRPQRALPAVVIHQRRGLLPVGLDAPLEHLRIVVGAQRLAARGRSRAIRLSIRSCRMPPSTLSSITAVELEALLLEHACRAPPPAGPCAGSRRG